MAQIPTGIDIGARSARFLRGRFEKASFVVHGYHACATGGSDIGARWSACDVPFAPKPARIGVTGRDVNVRYTQVPRVPDWQLRNLMRFEVEEIGEQSGSGLASDFNLLPPLPEIEGEDVVLLAMAREALLEEHMAGLAARGGALDAFTPNAVALYNAHVRFNVVEDEVVLVACIGHESTDVVIARGVDLLFARNLSGGSKLFDDAIAQKLSVSASRARELKERHATLDPGARQSDPDAERVARAVSGAAGQLLSLLQSSVVFAKSQIRLPGLKLDKVLLCGGGARMDGIARWLSGAMGVRVELFDPTPMLDMSKLEPEAAARLKRDALESVVALGLAVSAAADDAWSIEIVPAAFAKKREFASRTSWMIASGVLAAGFLGAAAFSMRSELADAAQRAKKLENDYKSASATHRRTEELLLENEQLEKAATELWVLKGAGEQAARGIDLLRSHLPGEFWITQLTSDLRAEPELGVARGSERPVLSLAGKAREGTNSLNTQYEAFVQKMRAALPAGAAMRERLTPNGARFTVDLCLYAQRPLDGAAPAAAPASGKQPGKERQ